MAQPELPSPTRITAPIVTVDTTSKVIADEDPDDGFDDTHEVTEIWYLLKSSPSNRDSKYVVSLENVSIEMNLDHVMNYCKNRDWDPDYKKLYKFFNRAQKSTDLVHFDDLREEFGEKTKYLMGDLQYMIDHFLRNGDSVILDKNQEAQSTFYLALYETVFSQGANYHLADQDTTFFLHVNYLMK